MASSPASALSPCHQSDLQQSQRLFLCPVWFPAMFRLQIPVELCPTSCSYSLCHMRSWSRRASLSCRAISFTDHWANSLFSYQLLQIITQPKLTAAESIDSSWQFMWLYVVPLYFWRPFQILAVFFKWHLLKNQTAFLHSAVSMTGLKHSQLLKIFWKGSVGPNDSGCHVSSSSRFIITIDLVCLSISYEFVDWKIHARCKA